MRLGTGRKWSLCQWLSGSTPRAAPFGRRSTYWRARWTPALWDWEQLTAWPTCRSLCRSWNRWNKSAWPCTIQRRCGCRATPPAATPWNTTTCRRAARPSSSLTVRLQPARRSVASRWASVKIPERSNSLARSASALTSSQASCRGATILRLLVSAIENEFGHWLARNCLSS